jgi:putative glycosyltransferase
MPVISVIMGVHNGEKTIKRAIDSILNQSFKDFEFIICDDCSTDNSFNLLVNIAKQDSRIVVLRNNTNLGLAATLNKCIIEARGVYSKSTWKSLL